MRLAFRGALRKKTTWPLTSSRRKRYKQADSQRTECAPLSTLACSYGFCVSFMRFLLCFWRRRKPASTSGQVHARRRSCHGSVKPIRGSRILQNEYSTWIIQDKHSRAYQALTGDIGERMARILKLAPKAEEAPKCLACHALNPPTGQRGTRVLKFRKACPARTATGRRRAGWGRTRRERGRMKNPSAWECRTRET